MKTITSKRIITKALATEGVILSIRFVDLMNPVWLVGEETTRIADINANSLDARLLAAIATGERVTCKVREYDPDDGASRVYIEAINDYIWIGSDHVASLQVLPSSTVHRADGMTKDIVLHPEGHAVVGCQTITRKGLQQIHEWLGKHLAVAPK